MVAHASGSEPLAGTVPAARVLAAYASALRFDDLPPEVVARVRDCIADTVGVCLGGARQDSSRIALAYAELYPGRGSSRLLDGSGRVVSAPAAALVNGMLSHALEYDSLRRPGAGVHPGATVVTAALALAQEIGSTGRDLIAAVTAGIEVMFRIGKATHHSCESRGFHAPGLTGPFGAAVAAGHLLGLAPGPMTRALGIAGSLASGMLEFAHAGSGSMVKKLHFGRAAEGGVLAARLAAKGLTAPESVLDGASGFLTVFCDRSQPELLTGDLGRRFEALNICFKRFPCHITAHAPVQAVLVLKARHGLRPQAVAEIRVRGSRKMATLHNIPEPADTGLAQYSIPFCIAVALAGNPADPGSYSEAALRDPNLRALCRRVSMQPDEPSSGRSAWGAEVTLLTTDGHVWTERLDDFPGTPTWPFDADLRKEKFTALVRPSLGDGADILFGQLDRLEEQPRLDWIGRAGVESHA